MVNYVEQHYERRRQPGLRDRRISSGGMMTNVLLGDYPDVFKAGAAFAGVPFACFANRTRRRLVEHVLRQRAASCKTGPAMGRPGARRLSRLHRRAAADAAVARHHRHHAATSPTSAKRSSSGPTCSASARRRPRPRTTPQSGWIRTRYVGGSGVVAGRGDSGDRTAAQSGSRSRGRDPLLRPRRFDAGSGWRRGWIRRQHRRGRRRRRRRRGPRRCRRTWRGGGRSGRRRRTRRRGRRRRHVSHRRKCRDEHRRRGGWRRGGSIREHGHGRRNRRDIGGQRRPRRDGWSRRHVRAGRRLRNGHGRHRHDWGNERSTGWRRRNDLRPAAGNAGSVGGDSAGCSCDTVCALDRNWLSALLLTLALVFRPGRRASWRATTSRGGRATRRRSGPP